MDPLTVPLPEAVALKVAPPASCTVPEIETEPLVALAAVACSST